MVKCVALVGRLLWRAVKLAKLCRFGCTLKNPAIYTGTIPIPFATYGNGGFAIIAITANI